MHKKNSIPFFNYPELFKSQEEEIMQTLHDVLSRGAFILQKDLKEFENSLSKFLNVKHAIGVADGTNALKIALMAAGIAKDDEVIMASHTYVATAASVHFAGGTPVLVECAHDHLIDPESVRKAVTKKTKVIMPTQLNGRTAKMDDLQKIADENGLIIIEDAAQALGSKFRGRCAGTFGLAGTYSFYPAKVLGCFGDGGAVVTNDDEMGRKLRLLRDHGRNENGEVVSWGTNSRLDNLQAAILNMKMKTFDDEIRRRREIASIYHKSLSKIDDLFLPPPPEDESDHYDIYQNYEIESGHRDDLMRYLEKNGIRTIIQWGGKAVHQFNGLGFENVKLPSTEKMFTRCMMLPMNTTLTNEDVAYICGVIHKFYQKSN